MPFTNRARAAWAAAGVICVTTACNDVPLLPQWDANWNVPLPTQQILAPIAVIPSGQSAPLPTTTQSQPLDKSLGDLLKNAADTGSLQLTLIKRPSLAVSGSLTADVDSTPAFGASKITVQVNFAATSDTTRTTASGVNIAMIHATADAGRTLYVRLSGSATNPGPNPVTITSANDTIFVKLNALTLIHVAQ